MTGNGSRKKVITHPWHQYDNYPPTPGESENQIRFSPGVPPLAIFSPLLGDFPKKAFSSQNLGKNANNGWGSWPNKVRTCTWDQNEKDSNTSRERKNVTNFPLAVTLRQFSPKIAKIGFSPLILGQNKPNKNLRTARGKITIPKMTTRWMCIIIGMIIRVENDFDLGTQF